MLFPWFQFLTYAFATAVTPGPNTLASMSNGGRLEGEVREGAGVTQRYWIEV